MDNKENLVTETGEVKVAENTEQTAEKTPRMYTEDEMNAKVDEILGKKIARTRAKIQKEYENKYGTLEAVLKAGTGKESVEDITDTVSKFYESKGVELPRKPEYTERDIAVLAKADADEIIRVGDDEVAEEVGRLTKIGDKMTARDRALYKTLSEHQAISARNNELKMLGVPEEEYTSTEFQNFANMFTSDIPITDIYDIYSKSKQKNNVRTMGSMKNNAVDSTSAVKEYYSPEEAKKFTQSEVNANPALFEAIRRSMSKWK